LKKAKILFTHAQHNAMILIAGYEQKPVTTRFSHVFQDDWRYHKILKGTVIEDGPCLYNEWL